MFLHQLSPKVLQGRWFNSAFIIPVNNCVIWEDVIWGYRAEWGDLAMLVVEYVKLAYSVRDG